MNKTSNIALIFCLIAVMVSCSSESERVDHPFNEIKGEAYKWFDIEGMQCRDGSGTGIGIRVNNPKRLAIYLNGGGACFNDVTCLSNPSSFTETDFNELVAFAPNAGIFNTERDENPLKDFSFLFIPYCTGDVHSGNTANGRPLNVEEPQKFVGYRNFTRAIEFIRPYFEAEDVEEILLFGLSAGGFGVYINFLQLLEAFPQAKITVVNDSGPVFADRDAFPLCLQLGFTLIFNIPVPSDLGNCCSPNYGLGNVYEYAATRYPNANYGIISSYYDQTSRFFLSFGQNGCTGAEGNSMPADVFKNGLIFLREEVLKKQSAKWSTFYIDDNTHTMLADNALFYDRQVDGMYLYEWLEAVMNGQVLHVDE